MTSGKEEDMKEQWISDQDKNVGLVLCSNSHVLKHLTDNQADHSCMDTEPELHPRYLHLV